MGSYNLALSSEKFEEIRATWFKIEKPECYNLTIHEVTRMELIREVEKWLEENTTGYYLVWLAIYFELEEDAIAFKLRWI